MRDRESADRWLARELEHWLGALRSAAELGEHEQASGEDQLLSALDEARRSDTRIEILVRLAELSDASGDTARAREHRVRALAECDRYDTPAVRGMAARLAADLGLPEPA